MDHEKFMRAAAALAEKNVVDGTGGPFGAVIVRDSEIVGEGTNQVTSSNDPTAHAEVVAIREACAKLETFNLDGCVIYTSCEPCPMCLSAIYWARLDHIFYGNTKADAAAKRAVKESDEKRARARVAAQARRASISVVKTLQKVPLFRDSGFSASNFRTAS